MCCRSSPRSTIRSIRSDYPLGWREYPPILWPEPLDKKGPESICGEWQLEREDSYGAAVFLEHLGIAEVARRALLSSTPRARRAAGRLVATRIQWSLESTGSSKTLVHRSADGKAEKFLLNVRQAGRNQMTGAAQTIQGYANCPLVVTNTVNFGDGVKTYFICN